MKRSRVAWALGVSALFFLHAARADCNEARALAQAEAFFKQHQAFYFKETPALRQAVSPALYRALQRHYRCAGVCHLDYDPWLGAQDGEIAEPIQFAVSSSTREKVEVRMSYRYDAGPGQPEETNTVRLRLSAVAPPRCWVLDDLVTPLGDSVLQRYRGKP